ncbi:hypothetical protein ACN47A_40105 [Myxococcus fulvus]|uniref:hypothetical protein n=1 Tax=Myxococcus fulvus TaxID=33 RepID=UPI003B9B7F4D
MRLLGYTASEEVRRALMGLGLTVGSDLHRKQEVEDVLLNGLDDFPEACVCLVFQDTFWAFCHGVFLLTEDGLDEARISWSLQADERVGFEVPHGDAARIPLATDADSLLDLFERAEPASGDAHLLRLPWRFSEPTKARGVLARVAAVLEPERFQVVVDLAGHYFVATLERKKGVTLAPLYPWVDDDEVRALMREAVGTPAPESFEPCPEAPARIPGASKRDAQRPFTTGSLKARLDSVRDSTLSRNVLMGLPKDLETSDGFSQLEAALKAPENAGARFSPLRSSLYQMLFMGWREQTLPLLLAGLETEPDEAVRGQLYACLSKVEDPAAYRALARGLKVEPPGVRERLAGVIWRQKGTVELLVREYLIPAWTEDRALADRIVKVLRDEYVEVPPAWVADAPEALRKVLESLLVKG